MSDGRIAIPIIVLLAALLLGGGRAPAQSDRLDPDRLARELERQGMTELLEHLLETEGDQFSDTRKQELRIAIYEGRYRNRSLTLEQRHEALDRMLEAYGELIRSAKGDPLRAVWQTDYAEMIILHHLRRRSDEALLFYDLGVPTKEQREAVEKYIPIAFEMLADADYAFFDMASYLPKQPDFHEKYVATGLWRKMQRVYKNAKTPYYTVYAAYYLAKLPDSHPYYQTLRKNPIIPDQAAEPEGERDRLLRLAMVQSDPFTDPNDDAFKSFRPEMTAFKALIQMRLGDYKAAEKTATSVLRMGARHTEPLMADLARAVALDALNKTQDAVDVLKKRYEEPIPGNAKHPRYRLLVIDCMHRILRKRAEQLTNETARRQKLADAYEVYNILFNDKELGDVAEGLKGYVFKRWESQFSDDMKVADLPPIVLMALGQLATAEGERLLYESRQLSGEGAEKKLAEARAKFSRAIEANKLLVNMKGVSKSTKATAMYNLGRAMYEMDRVDLENLLAATTIWVDLAEDGTLRDLPVAQKAIDHASEVLHNETLRRPADARLAKAYERAMVALFKYHADSSIAHDLALQYGFTMLQQNGHYLEAITVYSTVPADHVDYWEVQRQMLTAAYALYEQDGTREARELAESRAGSARREASQAAAELEQQIGQASSDEQRRQYRRRLAEATNVEGHARLVLARIELAQGNTGQAALAMGDDWRTRFGSDDDVLPEFLELSILINVKRRDSEETIRSAEQMMTKFPRKAALVISGVLRRLEPEVEKARRIWLNARTAQEKRDFRQELDALTDSGQKLGALLLDWALTELKKGGDDVTRADMAEYYRIHAKALRMAGEYKKGIESLEAGRQYVKNDPNLKLELAELHYDKGRWLVAQNQKQEAIPALAEAASIYRELEEAFREAALDRREAEAMAKRQFGIETTEEDVELMYSVARRMFWHSSARQFEIAVLAEQDLEDIALRKKALERLDPNLGGAEYAKRFDDAVTDARLKLSE